MLRAEAEEELSVDGGQLGAGVAAPSQTGAAVDRTELAGLPPAMPPELRAAIAPKMSAGPLEPPPHTGEPSAPIPNVPPAAASRAPPVPLPVTPPITPPVPLPVRPPVAASTAADPEPVRVALKKVPAAHAKPGVSKAEARSRPIDDGEESTQVIDRRLITAPSSERKSRGPLVAAAVGLAIVLGALVLLRGEPETPDTPAVTTPTPTVPDGAWDIDEAVAVPGPAVPAAVPLTAPAKPKDDNKPVVRKPAASAVAPAAAAPAAATKPDDTATKPAATKPAATKPKPRPRAKPKPKPKPTVDPNAKPPKLRKGARPEAKIKYLDRFCRKRIQCAPKLVDDFRGMRVRDHRTFWHRVDACLMMCAPGSLQ
jgi:hypothetical protein